MKHVTEAKVVVVKDTPSYYAVQIGDLLFIPDTLHIENKNSIDPSKVVVSFVCDADDEIIAAFLGANSK